MRALVSTALALAAALAADVALACPVCAQRQDQGPLGKVALGALIVSPWIAAAAVGWWIRRGILSESSHIGSENNE